MKVANSVANLIAFKFVLLEFKWVLVPMVQLFEMNAGGYCRGILRLAWVGLRVVVVGCVAGWKKGVLVETLRHLAEATI